MPLGVEDWTPTPEAVTAAVLAPGATLTRRWPLRMIQAGRLALVGTAVVGGSGIVANSQPVLLTIAAMRNLTPAMVLPVALGVPLAVLGGAAALLWQRRRRTVR